MDLEKLANILGAETVKKIYEDTASEPAKEASKAAVDIIKGLRLFTAPVQLLGAWQDRLVKYLEKVRGNVSEENQIEAPASIAGPVIERLKYLEEDNYLTDLYLNLLSRAIDKERIGEAHPAFFHIIDQLSADEALFLFKLREGPQQMKTYRDFDIENQKFTSYRITSSDIVMADFAFPDYFLMYYSHLESLNLVSWPTYKTEYPRNDQGVQIGLARDSAIQLTDFGALFVKACIPEKGFIIVK